MAPLLTLAILFLISFAFVFLTAIRRSSPKNKPRKNLPPSPPTLPFIGNFHQVAAGGGLVHQSLHKLSSKYGPLLVVHIGQVPTLVASSPETAREIMRTHDQVFATRPRVRANELLFFNDMDIIFSSHSENWRQLRKLCTVHLLCLKRVQSFARVREEEVALMVDKIRKSAADASNSSNKVDLSHFVFVFANDLVCRMVSEKFSRGEGMNTQFREVFAENVRLLLEFTMWDAFPSLSWLSVLTEMSARKNFRRLNALLDQMIEQYMKTNQTQSAVVGGKDGEKDFVDVLLSLPDSEIGQSAFGSNERSERIKPVLFDMFAAATDTTSITLEWAMAELVRNERVKEKLQEEVRRRSAGSGGKVTAEEVSGMGYLKAVVKETLRLHPAAPLVLPREAKSDCAVAGYEIPKGMRVLINAWAIHRDARCWEAPEEFRPERFVESAVDFKGNDFEFIPFGAGRRMCAGMQLAVATLELAIANLVLHFDWMPGESLPDMSEAPGVTCHKKEKLELIAIDRGL